MKYSFSKALQQTIDFKSPTGTAERVEHDAVAASLGRHGKKLLGGSRSGMFAPFSILAQRDYSIGTTGPANLSSTTTQDGGGILPSSAILRAGATLHTGATDQIRVSRVAGLPVASYQVLPDGSISISSSDPTFEIDLITPYFITAETTVSNQLLKQSEIAGPMVARALSTALASALDQSVLTGSGTAPNPFGALNDTLITKAAVAGSFASGAELSAIEASIAASRVDDNGIHCHPIGSQNGPRDAEMKRVCGRSSAKWV